jgi:hypothetical protein
MKLPTHIAGITHWYPYVSLHHKDDVCQIGNVRIEEKTEEKECKAQTDDAKEKMQEMAARMEFDSFEVDTARMQIVNKHKVKCLQSGVSSYGGSIRLKCALPTKKNNAEGIRAVFWQCIPTHLKYWSTSAYVSFGVVSNRTSAFVNAFNGLKDAYGVSTDRDRYGYKGNPQNRTRQAYVKDEEMRALVADFAKGSHIGIEYIVGESKLNFYRDDETEPKYTMKLPTDIAGITHWYPYVSLDRKGDVCQIGSVHIE